MRLTQNALKMLLKRYRSILEKNRLLNALGGMVLASSLLFASGAIAANVTVDKTVTGTTNITATSGNVILQGGVDNASGSITATGGNIEAVSPAGVNQPIIQGAGNKLDLSASGSITAGAMTVNSATAGKDISVTGTLQTVGGTADNPVYGDISAGGNINAFDAGKSGRDQAFDINVGNITTPGVIKGGEITIHGDLTADHVEALRNNDDTLGSSSGNPGTLTVHGALKIPGTSVTNRRLDVYNQKGSENIIGDVQTGACVMVMGTGEEASTLTGGKIAVGAGSFTIGKGVQAKVKEVIFDYPGRKARIHGGESKAPTTLELDKFIMFQGNVLAEAGWNSAYSLGVIKQLSPDETRPGILIGDGNIGVGANAMLGLGKNASLNWMYNIMKAQTGFDTPRQEGIKAMLALTQPLEIKNGFRVFINGDLYTETLKLPANTGSDADSPFVTTMMESGTFTQGADTMLVINGANDETHYATGTTRDASKTPGAISYDTSTETKARAESAGGDAKIEAGAKLVITGAQTGETYVVLGEGFDQDKIEFGQDESGAETGWQGENLLADNPLVSLSRNKDGSIEGQANSVSNLMPDLDGELVAVIDSANVANQIGLNHDFYNTGSKGTQFLSRAIRMAAPEPYGYGQTSEASQTIESAARMAVIGAVPQMAWAANQAAGAAITQRTSMANPLSNISAVDAEGNMVASSGSYSNGFALWVMPLYQSTNGFGMEAGNYDYDFSGDLGGVALGADWTFDNAVRAGISFNIGGGFAESSGGLNDTTNSMSFWGLGAYTGWNWRGFGLTADIDYTSTYNKLKQDLPSGMGWEELKSDITASALSVGLRAEYKFDFDALQVIPHLAGRFTYLNVDSYDIKHGGTVIEGDSMTQNIWTFPLGVTFTKNMELENGWHIKPLLDLNVTPATGDIKAKSKIRFTGTDYMAELDTKMMDYVTYGGTAGIEFGNENLSFGINYNGQFGAESSAHGIFGVFRYEF